MFKRNVWCFLVFFLLLLTMVGCESNSVEKKLFPKVIKGYELKKLIKGGEAIKMINRLHGKKIRVKQAWIAYYANPSNPKDEVTVWVSQAFSEADAKKQFNEMMEKIMKNPMPFSNIINMMGVYVFSGLGKRHAVFCRKDFVFWISGREGSIRYFVHYYFKTVK